MYPKLALGTVQFGMPYGVMNTGAAAVRKDEVAKILASAWRRGIDMLDTAVAYGNADDAIAAVRPPEASFAVVTKLRSCGDGDVAARVDDIGHARELLGIPAFYATLLHRADDLLGAQGAAVARALCQLRGSGVCERIGVSVYDPATLDAVLDRAPIEIVQLPLNVLDQRFVRSGAIERLKSRGIEVHVRSAFLQGILLADPGRLPSRFAPERLAAYQAARRQAGLSAAAAALRFVLTCSGVDRVVFGVDSVAHLNANIDAYDEACRWQGDFDYAPHAIDDLDVIDPRYWSVLEATLQ